VTVLVTVTVETIVDGTVAVTVCWESVVWVGDGIVDGAGESLDTGASAGPLPGPLAGPLPPPPAGPAFGPFPGSGAGPFAGPGFDALGVVVWLVPAGAGASFDGWPRVATSR
jgi:hypothetical protein